MQGGFQITSVNKTTSNITKTIACPKVATSDLLKN